MAVPATVVRWGAGRRLTPAGVLAAAATAALVLYPFVFRDPFPQHVMIMVFLYAALGQAWNILGGYAGQVSLGHAVFFGIGAYTSTLLGIHYGTNPWLGMAAGVALAVAVAQVVGWVCFRLRGHYFVIATLAIAEIVQTVAINTEEIGGALGLIIPIRPESLVALQFHSSKVPYYFLFLALAIGVGLTTRAIERSRPGHYFRAIKADPDAARSVGINLWRYKLIALTWSTAFTALAGTLYAQYVLYIDPFSVFPLRLSVMAALVAVLGGTGTVWGPPVGALVLIPLSEYSRAWLSGGGQAVDLMLYGFLIILFAVFQPDGLMGLARRFRRGLRAATRGASIAGGGG